MRTFWESRPRWSASMGSISNSLSPTITLYLYWPWYVSALGNGLARALVLTATRLSVGAPVTEPTLPNTASPSTKTTPRPPATVMTTHSRKKIVTNKPPKMPTLPNALSRFGPRAIAMTSPMQVMNTRDATPRSNLRRCRAVMCPARLASTSDTGRSVEQGGDVGPVDRQREAARVAFGVVLLRRICALVEQEPHHFGAAAHHSPVNGRGGLRLSVDVGAGR